MEERTELIEARKARGLSQIQLAEAVGIDNTYLCKIEAGKTPSPVIMGKLAAHLGKPAADLFRELAPTG